MKEDLLDNTTRKHIILALKKHGGLSVEDLSREVSITPMGVRQHLHILERNGIVDYITKRQGIGRPSFLYRLTEGADELFPKDYAEFSIDILKDIEEKEGKKKIEEIFSRRKERILAQKIKTFGAQRDLSSKVSSLLEMLQEDGGIVELEETDTHFMIKQFNCPISKIAANFREVCAYDLQLYQKLIGAAVTMEQNLAVGGQACVFAIPKT